MPSLYEIISELRQEHRTPAATRTIDLVMSELGRTQDNLREALAHLDGHSLPAGGPAILEELARRADAAGVEDLRSPESADELKAAEEPVDSSTIGIAALLAISTLLPLALLAVVIVSVLRGGHG